MWLLLRVVDSQGVSWMTFTLLAWTHGPARKMSNTVCHLWLNDRGSHASQPLSVHSQQALLAVSSAHHAGLHPCLDGVLLVVNCTIFVLMFTWLVYSSTTLFHPHCLSRANSCLRTIKEHVFGSAKDRTHSPTYARQNLYYWATSPPARRRYIVYYWCKVDRNSN